MRLFLLLLLYFIPLFAIVDIATVDFQENPEGFSGSLYGSFEKKRGNTDKNEVELGGRIQYDNTRSITWFQAELEYDEASDITTDDNAFMHLRHVHQLYSPEWAWELFLQDKRDKFKNLRFQFLAGAGLRYRFFSSEEYGKLFLGLSLMDEQIDYLDDAVDQDEHNTRLNSYLSYKLRFNQLIDISTKAYYQPMIDQSSDFLFSSQFEMTIHLTKVLDLSYLTEYDYDARPPFDVEQEDFRQKFSFVYRFGKDDPFSAYAHNFLSSSDNLEDANVSEVVAVAVKTDVDEIKDETDTVAGEWEFEEERFTILLDGKGSYHYGQGVFDETIEWTVVATQTQEGVQGAKDQSTKLVIIKHVDQEGRQTRVENYLWSENSLVGLTGSRVRHFKR
jgi:hypothetical protein